MGWGCCRLRRFCRLPVASAIKCAAAAGPATYILHPLHALSSAAEQKPMPVLQGKVDIDTVIVDEAGCVPEMAIPILIRHAPAQLVLIGDHLQLPAFTDLHQPPPNHTRRHVVM